MEKHEDRLIFLKEFTKELIINSKPKGMPIKRIKEEKIENEKIMLPAIELPASQDLASIKQVIQESTRDLPIPLEQTVPLVQRVTMEIEEPEIISQSVNPPQLLQPRFPQQPRTPQIPRLPSIPKSVNRFLQPEIPQKLDQAFQPTPQPLPINFDLGRINFLVSDPRVTSIECQGPGKLVITRVFGRPSATKVSLTQEEITGIIAKFSQEAKIPVISGLFKAAVGNLIITAVISDLVGSRFIITKITPAFILDQNPPVSPGNFPY